MENILIALLQRVKKATVEIEKKEIASIRRGLLVFIAFKQEDSSKQVFRLVKRILNYRIFPDENNKMNKSVLDEALDVLVVPQFTLAADTNSGNRPGFSRAAEPILSKKLFLEFIECISSEHEKIHCGVFAANMQVSLINDGPVTFWLEVD